MAEVSLSIAIGPQKEKKKKKGKKEGLWLPEIQRWFLLFVCKVRKSLEQIRIFTEHKDALAQEIQDENDQLKEQLRQLISLQG